MEDWWLLDVQGIHTFSDIQGHSELLLVRQIDLLLLMEKGEECATEAVLCEDEDKVVFDIDTGAHKIDQVGMVDLSESCNLSLELL